MTCGKHSRTELNSDEDTQTYTSLPVFLEKGHGWLVPTWESLWLSLRHTGRSSFEREENEHCLGPVKVFAHSLKRGGLRDRLGCPLILTSWRPERLNNFARWHSSRWHTWDRNQPFVCRAFALEPAVLVWVRASECAYVGVHERVSVRVRDWVCDGVHVCMCVQGMGGGGEPEQRTSRIIINRKPGALAPLFLARGSLRFRVGLRWWAAVLA